MTTFEQVTVDETGWSDWIQPQMDGYKMACCDCGLVHSLVFRIEGDRVQFRASRNNRSTGQMRRHMSKAGASS